MLRSTFLLAASIIVATCFACASPAPQPPAPAPSVTLACSTIANVRMLSPSFDPTLANGTPVSTGPAPANIQADLITAYNTAPPFFKNQLCNLTGIFVTSDFQSWGYRNVSDGSRYIAISTSLWSGNPPAAITLDQYENRVFGPPLSWPQPPIDSSPPTYLPVTPNVGSMTILAALAHEFGHVFWSDILVFPRGSDPQSSRFCTKILTNSWTGNLQPAVWKKFEDLDANPANIPDDDPSDPPLLGDPGPADAKVIKMINALRANNITKAHKILSRILAQARPFPSLFGAFSADEQFVETFTLFTLMNASPPLTSAPLQISPGLVRDIPATASHRKRLAKVLQCFPPLVNPTPPRP